MRDDISQEDIEAAIRRAGSTRRFIDRQDYVMALKELGGGAVLRGGVRYSDVNDHDLSEFILHAEGGGTGPGTGTEDTMLIFKEFPDVAAVQSQDVFMVNGRCQVQCYLIAGPVDITGTIEGVVNPNLIPNGALDTPDGWVIPPDWAWENGVFRHIDPLGTAFLQYPVPQPFPAGYRKMELDITGTVGNVDFGGQNINFDAGHGVTAGNSHMDQYATHFSIKAEAGFDGTIDNIKFFDVPECTLQVGYTQRPDAFISMRLVSNQGAMLTIPANAFATSDDPYPPPSSFMMFTYDMENQPIRMDLKGGGRLLGGGSYTLYCRWTPNVPGGTVTVL